MTNGPHKFQGPRDKRPRVESRITGRWGGGGGGDWRRKEETIWHNQIISVVGSQQRRNHLNGWTSRDYSYFCVAVDLCWSNIMMNCCGSVRQTRRKRRWSSSLFSDCNADRRTDGVKRQADWAAPVIWSGDEQFEPFRRSFSPSVREDDDVLSSGEEKIMSFAAYVVWSPVSTWWASIEYRSLLSYRLNS